MANSGDVLKRIVEVLAGDPTLAGLAPDGVFQDVADENAQRYIVIALIAHIDDPRFDGDRDEHFRFQIRAVGLASSSTTGLDAAAARIFALLDRRADLGIPGYGTIRCERAEYVDDRRPDAANASIWWAHRGGAYVIDVQPLN